MSVEGELSFGDVLSLVLEETGVSQAELERRSGFYMGFGSRLIHNDREATPAELETMVRELELNQTQTTWLWHAAGLLPPRTPFLITAMAVRLCKRILG